MPMGRRKPDNEACSALSGREAKSPTARIQGLGFGLVATKKLQPKKGLGFGMVARQSGFEVGVDAMPGEGARLRSIRGAAVAWVGAQEAPGRYWFLPRAWLCAWLVAPPCFSAA